MVKLKMQMHAGIKHGMDVLKELRKIANFESDEIWVHCWSGCREGGLRVNVYHARRPGEKEYRAVNQQFFITSHRNCDDAIRIVFSKEQCAESPDIWGDGCGCFEDSKNGKTKGATLAAVFIDECVLMILDKGRPAFEEKYFKPWWDEMTTDNKKFLQSLVDGTYKGIGDPKPPWDEATKRLLECASKDFEYEYGYFRKIWGDKLGDILWHHFYRSHDKFCGDSWNFVASLIHDLPPEMLIPWVKFYKLDVVEGRWKKVQEATKNAGSEGPDSIREKTTRA